MSGWKQHCRHIPTAASCWLHALPAKAVEDCDAQLLALSVTGMRDADGHPVVMLRANTRAADGIARSLARYGYEVVHSAGDLTPAARSEAMARVNELLHYLEI